MKYKTCTNMKDSGLEWVGEIPEDWKVSPLKFILQQGKLGIKIGPFGSSLKLDIMVKNGYKVYGQENVIANDFDSGHHFIVKEKFNEMKNYEVLAGDIVVTMMGTTGLARTIPKKSKIGIMDSHLVRIRTDPSKFYNKFLAFLINDSNYAQIQLKLASKGVIMEGLNSSILKSIILVFPPNINEQKDLLKHLDHNKSKIDLEISNNKTLLKFLNEKRQETINQAIIKGTDLNVPMEDSGIEWIGKIPKHWKLFKLKHVTKKIFKGIFDLSPNNYIENGYPFLRISNIVNNKIDYTNMKYVDEEILIDNPSSVLESNDLVMAKVGSAGEKEKSAILPQSNKNYLISQNLIGIKIKSLMINEHFLLNSLQFENFLHTIILKSHVTTLKSLRLDVLRNSPIPVPSLEEQKNIVDFIYKQTSKIDLLIDKTKSQIKNLEQFRQTLIESLITGKTCITN